MRKTRIIINSIQLVLIITVVFIYRNMFDNPFIHDDFLWLHSGQHIANGDLSSGLTLGISTPYYPYFIHLLFGLSFKLFGMTYQWYHVISVVVHLLNAILVFSLLYLFFKDYLWALLVAFFFAVNPVISNAILWPSDWVDLFAALGFLTSLLSYKLFLDKNKPWLYGFALLGFLISLFSKIIGIGLPLILLYMEGLFVLHPIGSRYKEISKRLLPFLSVSICYLFLIIIRPSNAIPIHPQGMLRNLFRYIPALFIPEAYNTANMLTMILFTLAFLGVLIFLYLSNKEKTLFTLLLIIVSMAPLLVLDFSLKPIMLIDSISHRLYLPSIGSQMLIGLMVFNVYQYLSRRTFNNLAKVFIGLCCSLFFTYSTLEINRVEKAWDSDSKNIFNLLTQLKLKVERFPPNSLVYLINSPSSAAFWEPMVRVYYNDSSVKVTRYPNIADFSRYKEVYAYLYINGTLVDNDKSIIRLANYINSGDIDYVLKFYEIKGQEKEKVAFLRGFSALFYNDPDIHYKLALIFRDMRMWSDSESEFKAALIISPFNMKTHYYLGLLYISEKRYELANKELQFVAHDKTSPWAPMADEFLKIIRVQEGK